MASRFSVDDVDRFGCTSPPGYIVDQGFIQTPYVWGEIAGIGCMSGVWGLCPQQSPEAEHLVGGLGGGEAESFSLHK